MQTKKYLVLAGIVVLVIISLSLLKTIATNFNGMGSRNIALSRPATDLPAGGTAYGLGAPAMMKSEIAQDSTSDRIMMPISPPDAAPVANVNPEDRKIVKNGSLNIVVKDVNDAVKKISSQATTLGGYVSTTNLNNSGNKESIYGYVQIRVPVDKVTQFVDYVKSTATKVKSENINSQDVTSEYIDLQARIKNLETSEAQYQEFMKRANTVEEVLKVQKELTTVRGQIEQLKGQLKYLEGNAAMSDITVNVALDESELPVPPEDAWKPDTVFKLALRDLIQLSKNLSYLAIYLAVYAIVWVPVGLGLWWLYRFLRRKIK